MERLGIDDARFEVKYACAAEQNQAILGWLERHPAGFWEPFPERRVNSLYFDSHGFDAYYENLSGASARSKVRLRWYGESLSPEAGTFEVKLRRGRLGWKRSHPIDRIPALGKSGWHDVCGRLRDALPPEHRLRLDAYGIPTVLSGYQRRYFESSDGRVRVTLDLDHFAYDQHTSVMPNVAFPASVPSPLIVEVKFGANDTAAGKRVTSTVPARLSRNSKYMINVASIHA